MYDSGEKLRKEFNKYTRWRRWLMILRQNLFWLTNPRQWWRLRKEEKNLVITATTADPALQPEPMNMDGMLKLLRDVKPIEPKAIIVSKTTGEGLKKHASADDTPKNLFPGFPTSYAMKVLSLPDEVYNRIGVDVNKTIMGPETEIIRLYNVMQSKYLSESLLQWLRDKIEGEEK